MDSPSCYSLLLPPAVNNFFDAHYYAFLLA